MRIVLVNWASISDGAANGGGVNIYGQQLALELTSRGHEVVWLCGGVHYVPSANPAEVAAECRVRRHQDHGGVRVFEVINSPVLAPGPCQFRDPLGEVSAPSLEQEVTRFFHLIEPDIVHFQNIEGFSVGCVDAARTPSPTWPGAKVVFSLHNYHTVCPQVYLMRHGRRPCLDFDSGHACTGCVDAADPGVERKSRGSAYSERFTAPANGNGHGGTQVGLAQLFGSKRAKPILEYPWPGKPVENYAHTVPERAQRTAEHYSPRLLALDMESPDWQPVTNQIAQSRADPGEPRPLNDYGRRRKAMTDMLSRCDRVIAVSEFVRSKFESLGVSPGVLTTLPIGSRMSEIAGAAPELLFTPPPFDTARPRPIRVVFMGYNNYYKGLPMLADTLELLTPEYLARIELFVYAKAVEEIEWRLRRLEGRLAGLTVRSAYLYEDIPAMLSGKDVGLVPSVWWDNGPQTVMEYMACGLPVIGAELGGIPDIVKHGHNGLLFRGNDRFDFARTLVGITNNPNMLLDLRRNVCPPRSIPQHTSQMEALYEQCLAGRA